MEIQAEHFARPVPPASAERSVLIAIPFYKNELLVESVVGSLIACSADVAAIRAEVIFYDDSPDYLPLAAALDAMVPRAAAMFPCRLVRNPVNLGFVKTMNRAIAEAVERRCDLLLLNSDTIVTPGALTEMVRIAAFDPMIGFVSPRSNNATLTTLPVPPARLEDAPDAAREAYAALAARLPAFSYAPTAVGFCMLVRWAILAEFGGFDEIYGHGYNEENDLVMRASRCGYRVALANKAFVWHESERSFSSAGVTKAEWEPVNRAILDTRYPEYGAYTGAHFHAPETLAETLLGTLTPDRAGRLDLAFDFSTFGPQHNGTYQAGKQLLQAAVAAWADRFKIHVLCSQETHDFHGYGGLGAVHCDPHGPERFAVIFRVGQPYDWETIQRLVIKGAVLGIYMLDTISIDCTQLTSPHLYNLWQFALTHTDVMVALSRQTSEQLSHRFRIPDHVVQVQSLLSLNVADYRLTDCARVSGRHPGSPPMLLVIGNHFPHKYTAPTANALAAAFPDRSIVALGQIKSVAHAKADPLAPHGLDDLENLTGVVVGTLSEAELAAYYADADAIVFPSHYEGFGIPVLNSLAARRPLYVRRLPVFEELWDSQDRTPNIHFYETTTDLIQQLRTIARWDDSVPLPAPDNGADRSAREIRAGLEAALRQIDYQRIVDRLRAIQFPGQLGVRAPQASGAAANTAAAFAAHFLAVRVEHVARMLFDRPLLFAAARLVARILRAGFRALRRV
ncbi:MAG TPA: glycosyltransferase [Aliidongia sp.]|uniref:glycosyltransferase n=1 Tax=Aliidongia sp. TaxID=1914230 RepID=UPI002DDCCC3F|nr:glycosyltransferase [Aliidongia sp.]HEV2677618.1 glycosyltransferase [Aliidongia sp.]